MSSHKLKTSFVTSEKIKNVEDFETFKKDVVKNTSGVAKCYSPRVEFGRLKKREAIKREEEDIPSPKDLKKLQ